MSDDLISRSALIDKAYWHGERPDVGNPFAEGVEAVDVSDIEEAPTIEAEPVRHGRWEECDWVEYDGHSECVHYPKKARVCTKCRNAFKKEFIDNPRVHYCPHCGAKMDGET